MSGNYTFFFAVFITATFNYSGPQARAGMGLNTHIQCRYSSLTLPFPVAATTIRTIQSIVKPHRNTNSNLYILSGTNILVYWQSAWSKIILACMHYIHACIVQLNIRYSSCTQHAFINPVQSRNHLACWLSSTV